MDPRAVDRLVDYCERYPTQTIARLGADAPAYIYDLAELRAASHARLSRVAPSCAVAVARPTHGPLTEACTTAVERVGSEGGA